MQGLTKARESKNSDYVPVREFMPRKPAVDALRAAAEAAEKVLRRQKIRLKRGRIFNGLAAPFDCAQGRLVNSRSSRFYLPSSFFRSLCRQFHRLRRLSESDVGWSARKLPPLCSFGSDAATML